MWNQIIVRRSVMRKNGKIFPRTFACAFLCGTGNQRGRCKPPDKWTAPSTPFIYTALAEWGDIRLTCENSYRSHGPSENIVSDKLER
jgi:hypothetical protein